ncbi:MAG: hypothetical protein IPP33_18505 [Flavobacteriales bacterium]|nr:hypothetical protein [Flavobacteriales bacterium]
MKRPSRLPLIRYRFDRWARLAVVLALQFPLILFGQASTMPSIVNLDIKGVPLPVYAFVKDNDGFLWIGTDNGLCRYDGINLDIYRTVPGDSSSLVGKCVSDLLLAKDGRIWLAANWGIAVFDPRVRRFEHKVLWRDDKVIPKYESTDLFFGADDVVHATCQFHGLARFDQERDAFVAYEKAERPLDTTPRARFAHSGHRDAKGIIWLVQWTSLLRFDPNTNEVRSYDYTHHGEPPANKTHLFRAYDDPTDENILWLSSHGMGLVRFDKRTGEFSDTRLVHEGEPDLVNGVRCMIPLDTTRWLVSYDLDLRIYDTRSRTFGPALIIGGQVPTPFRSAATALSNDGDGHIWIGSAHGMHLLPLPSPRFERWPQRMSNFCITPDDEGYWGASYYTGRKLFRFDGHGTAIDSFPLPGSENGGYEPFNILRHSSGIVWIATTKGLVTFDPLKRTAQRKPVIGFSETGSTPYVSSMVEQPDGTLWCLFNGTGPARYASEPAIGSMCRTNR